MPRRCTKNSLLISGQWHAAQSCWRRGAKQHIQGQTARVVFAARGVGRLLASPRKTPMHHKHRSRNDSVKTHLGNSYSGVDGNSIGVLGTPVIDPASGPDLCGRVRYRLSFVYNNPNHGGNNFEVLP